MNQGEFDLMVKMTTALESLAQSAAKIAESLEKKSAPKPKAH